jgi:hypothetical protein
LIIINTQGRNPSRRIGTLNYRDRNLSLIFPFSWYLGIKTVDPCFFFLQAGTRISLHNNFCVDRSKLLVHFFIHWQHASIPYFHCITPFCCHFFSSYCFTAAHHILPVSTCSMVIDHWSDFFTLTGCCCEYRASDIHRSLIWLFHLNRPLLWVAVYASVTVQRSFLSLSRISSPLHSSSRPWVLYHMSIFDLFTATHTLPFQVKGVRVDMPPSRPFQARDSEKGVVAHPAYLTWTQPLRPLPCAARGCEYIIFTFCPIRDIGTWKPILI